MLDHGDRTFTAPKNPGRSWYADHEGSLLERMEAVAQELRDPVRERMAREHPPSKWKLVVGRQAWEELMRAMNDPDARRNRAVRLGGWLIELNCLMHPHHMVWVPLPDLTSKEGLRARGDAE